MIDSSIISVSSLIIKSAIDSGVSFPLLSHFSIRKCCFYHSHHHHITNKSLINQLILSSYLFSLSFSYHFTLYSYSFIRFHLDMIPNHSNCDSEWYLCLFIIILSINVIHFISPSTQSTSIHNWFTNNEFNLLILFLSLHLIPHVQSYSLHFSLINPCIIWYSIISSHPFNM